MPTATAMEMEMETETEMEMETETEMEIETETETETETEMEMEMETETETETEMETETAMATATAWRLSFFFRDKPCTNFIDQDWGKFSTLEVTICLTCAYHEVYQHGQTLSWKLGPKNFLVLFC